MSGFRLYDYLSETGLIERCLSVGDPVVKGWCEHPETYSEQFRNFDPEFDNKRVYLWKSTRHASDSLRTLEIAYLRISGDKVIVEWDQNLGQPFYNCLHLTAIVSTESSKKVSA